MSLESNDDDDFARLSRPCRDCRLPVQYRSGDFVSSDLPRAGHPLLRSGGLKVRLAQGNCVGEFKGKGSGRVFGNNQR